MAPWNPFGSHVPSTPPPVLSGRKLSFFAGGQNSAAATAPLAFLSSRASARPMVADFFHRMQQKGLGRAIDYMKVYDERTEACLLAGGAKDEAPN